MTSVGNITHVTTTVNREVNDAMDHCNVTIGYGALCVIILTLVLLLTWLQLLPEQLCNAAILTSVQCSQLQDQQAIQQ